MLNKDQVMYAGLKKLLDDGTFPIRKREGVVFAQICQWVEKDLGEIIDKQSKPSTPTILSQEKVKPIPEATKKKTTKKKTKVK